MKVRLLYIFLLSMAFYGGIKAQNPFTINYSIDEGLPSGNVYSFYQEENGIMWFTTDVGIVRYDSKNFKLFNTDDGLSDNEVFRMKKDSKGRVWLLTLNGKPCYMYKGKFYNSKNSELLKKITSSGFIIDFLEDEEQNVHLAFRSGEIYSIDKNDRITKKTNFTPYLLGIWKQNNHLYSIESGSIYDFSKNKIYAINSILPFRTYHDATYGDFVNTFNVLYKASGNQLNTFLELPDAVEIINIKWIDKHLWVCTRNGVYEYENHKLVHHYFDTYVISDVLKDMEGNFWFSSLNKGILMVPSLEIKQILAEKKINVLAFDPQGKLWIGGYENNYYVKGKSTESFEFPPNLRKDKITDFKFSKDTIFVLGKTGSKVFTPHKNYFIYFSINDLEKINNLYVTATSFTCMNTFDDYLSHLKTIHHKTILNKRSNVLEKDNENNVWIGTNFGLNYYNSKDSVVNMAEKWEDLSVSIEELYFDNETNTLMVATTSKGVVMIKNKKVIGKFSVAQNLNNNTITGIKKIGSKTYLVGSNNGLNEIDLNENKVLNYNTLLGLQNKKIKDIEFKQDTVYLATDNGVIYFNRNKILAGNTRPKCIINNILSNNVITNSKIPYAKNNISITYTGVSYRDKGNVTYFYRLSPKDKEWYKTDETQVNFKSLPSGKYTFEIYAESGNLLKSEIKSIPFEVMKPFWQETWFFVFVFLLFVWALYYVIKYQLNKIKTKFKEERNKIQAERDKARLEKNIVELEQKALRLQMNPHFIFNALNTIKGYYTENDPINASNYISKFSKLLRMLLENEEKTITLDKELEMIQLYIDLTKIRYPEKFEYQVEVDSEIPVNELTIPNLILQPVVENAIIHGLSPKATKGVLKIKFSKINDFLMVTVEDNGIGRVAANLKQQNREYQSKSGQIVEDRLKLFDERSTIEYKDLHENNKASGTSVILKIPIKTIWE